MANTQQQSITKEDFARLFKTNDYHPNVKKITRFALEYQFSLNAEVAKLLPLEGPDELNGLKDKRLELNDKLLQLICDSEEEEMHTKFLKCLPPTLQEHLEKFIQRKGDMQEEEPIRPLFEAEIKKFRGLRRFIRDEVTETTGTVGKLVQAMLNATCISKDHHQYIISQLKDSKEQLKEQRGMDSLMDIVERRSFQHYMKFFNCLCSIRCTRIFHFLTEVGIAVELCCYASKSDEQKIVTAFKDVKAYEKFQEILNRYDTVADRHQQINRIKNSSANNEGGEEESGAQQGRTKTVSQKFRKGLLRVLGVFRGCVRVYLYCPDTESLDWVHNKVLEGRLKDHLQNSFNKFLEDAGHVTLNHVFLSDYNNQKFLFEYANAQNDAAKQALLRNGEENMKKVFKMPTYARAREQILSKAFLFRALYGTKKSSKPKVLAANHLSTVCKDWWKTLEQQTVKSILKRPLHKLLNKPELETKLKSGVIWNVGDQVICITTLLEDLYVVTESKRNVIQRCNLNTLEKLSEQQQTSGTSHQPTMHVPVRMTPEIIPMPEELKISYIEASEKENGIFFIEEGNGNIWFWSKGEGPPSQSSSGVTAKQQRQASVMKQFSPSKCITVSVDKSSDEMRILLLPEHNILEIHPQHSKIIETVNLPPSVHEPKCVIRNSEGYIFVGHGNEKRSRICMINNDGVIVLTYGDKPKGDPEKLNEPCSMTLGDDDCIYVADKGNNRVLLLDSKMHLIKVLLDEKYDDIINPTSMSYVKTLNNLVVTCKNSIHIYSQGEFQFAKSPQGESTQKVPVEY